MSELLTEARLRAVLGDRPFRFYSQIASTNDAAREWAEAGAPPGAVIVAEAQTAGRGRFARRWQAPAGTGLLFSLIVPLRPTDAEVSTKLPLAVGIAAAEALEQFGVHEVKLKWPNDLLIQGRKVCGILAEATWSGQKPLFAIVGIGLNVRVDFSGSDLIRRAISLETVLGRPIDRAALLKTLLAHLDGWLLSWNSPAMIGIYQSRWLLNGQRVAVHFAESDGNRPPLTGQALRINADGGLIILDDDNRQHCLYAGEVTLS